MQYFPVYFRLAGRPALLVGGGEAAVRKLRLLRRAGARVTVVAPEADGEIAELAGNGDVVWQRREFRHEDLASPALVIVATESAADDRIAEAAREAGVPVNAVDRPELSTFIMPAIVDRDGIVVAISSGGAAPVLARRIRERIEALLPGRVVADLQRLGQRLVHDPLRPRPQLVRWRRRSRLARAGATSGSASSTAPSRRRCSTATSRVRAVRWPGW